MRLMDSLKQKEQACTRPFCFFCTMKEPDSFKRRAGISACFKELPLGEDQGNVLVLSSLWQIAMTHPDDPEFPSLGIFECMAKLIFKGINNKCWLQTDQNIYIPYYAAHVIGSYTMNKAEFAEKAVASGVIPPLLDLLRGKMSWVEQRVAARALGHLASYERTSEAVAQYEEEVVRSAMKVASTCLHVVYVSFVGVKDKRKRQKYHCDLLTRGVGGLEMEICKAEEWASQLQCWSLNILNCFACKEKSLNLICKQDFLKQLCGMWGGLANRSSPAGVGLIRILCYSKYGRKKISESREVIESLCNISRSSDDWQYMGIDCLLLLLKDPDTRYKVIDIAALFLVDLVELRSLGDRSNLGETITKALLLTNYKQGKLNKNRKIEKNLEELWNLKVERRKREEDCVKKKLRKEWFWWIAQCQLLMRDSDAAIRDSTRALCLSTPVNSHSKSLWRRSQAYDMKGLAKESLMDCLAFINGCIKSERSRRVKIPHYAARMISKQMEATWLFATARSTMATRQDFQVMKQVQESEGKGNLCESGDDKQDYRDEIMRVMMEKKGLSTILEEPLIVKEESRRKMERTRRV
ncbi:ARM-repeat/Tetratricopeptide repeat-like protein [Prunus dulcis]|uniref:ARM-repeat/Tetratricopeptide repeat-like protein n=1 Tax=Prunus dulcis TaxID=3755 RepID=A0A4Y1QTN8_PRUDU|nr:ARM-repeat/Tetratricopeptide repeat-like protein [Prunus dulcis]